ncbi:MAG TPA: bifunctional glutamate N-acetyltransferase/amino-acid acetyltransferase ArgJ [bacterium]
MKIKGFLLSGIAAGIKKNGKKDLALILSEVASSAAGVFTTNVVKAAPVIITEKRIKKGYARAILANSGCANACTGNEGEDAALMLSDSISKSLGIRNEEILLASTGVIGEPMPVRGIRQRLPVLIKNLSANALNYAAEAIMTTDTFPKIAGEKVKIGRDYVSIAGIAKGAGMIQPGMATMLSFIITDADVNPEALRLFLQKSVEKTFNRITVDGDMSTNDTVLMLANGLSGVDISVRGGIGKFSEALENVCKSLSLMIVKDGEGATKVVEIEVQGAKSKGDARQIAYKIGNSPLVKTAIFGCDPNWGRVLAAAGASGVRFDPNKTDIFFDNVQIVKNGIGTGREDLTKKIMAKKRYRIIVNIRSGDGCFSLFTSDMTHEYITINSSYRS